MQHSFLGDYEQLRQEVYAGGGNGEYPVDTRSLAGAIHPCHRHADRHFDSHIADHRGIRAEHHARPDPAHGEALCAVADRLRRGVGGFIKVAQTANALFKQKELAEVTLHSIGDAVITTDAQARVEYMNPVAEELTAGPAARRAAAPSATCSTSSTA